MISSLGTAMVLAALAISALGTVTAFAAARTRSRQALDWARRSAYAFAGLMIAANVLMIIALLLPDFSVGYVAQVGSRQVPRWVQVVSLWSSLEGSILFWGAVLGGYVALSVYRMRGRHPDAEPWALGVILACSVFFSFLIAGPADPFHAVPNPPPDGPGPNPLLQNHLLMVVHPPLLYLGYVGMVVPFGLAAAALFSGKLGPALLRSIRTWLLVPWIFLTVGIVMGGWWAYEVLGWGGYWAWDPVENASLLPWLTATAAMHSVMVIERKGLLKGWTLTLVLSTFLLTILGTFMTRSGVFNSVHSFTQSDIGPTFLVFLAACLVFSVLLLAARIGKLQPEGTIAGAASREAMFFVNNLILVLITLTVLLGTVFPLLAEAVRGVQISVGEPYFNRMSVPLGVALLFLMGIGPALPWGGTTPEKARRALTRPIAGGLTLLTLGLILGARSPWMIATLFAGGYAFQVTFGEMLLPALTRLRKGGVSGASIATSLGALLKNRRRFGAYLAHLGVVLVIVAIAVSSTARVSQEVTLREGQSVVVEDYQLTFRGIETRDEPHRQSVLANLDVSRNGRALGTLSPRLNYYFIMREPIGTPAVRTTLKEDLYASAMSIDTEQKLVGVRVFVNPMVVWLWIGTAIIALGGFIAVWPRRGAATADARSTRPTVTTPVVTTRRDVSVEPSGGSTSGGAVEGA